MDLELELKKFLDQYCKPPRSPDKLYESLSYSVLSPGKRIRPRIALATGELLKLPVSVTLPFAVSLECIHCFTLIHDDLPCLDDDDFRRGIPANHKKFGEGMALLAGDALIPLAFEIFLESSQALSLEQKPYFTKALALYLKLIGASGVIGGQAQELALVQSNQSMTTSERDKIHQLKTGTLFEAAILIPLELTGPQKALSQEKVLSAFSKTLGLAFQAADDLEDLKESDRSLKQIKELQELRLLELAASKDSLTKEFGASASSLLPFIEEIRGKLATALP